jgi:hypothetical protein
MKYSFTYNYSPKKTKNLLRFFTRTGKTVKISQLLPIIEEVREKKLCIPLFCHRKGESHKPLKVRSTKLPGGFFPKKIDDWYNFFKMVSLKEEKIEGSGLISRIYFHEKKIPSIYIRSKGKSDRRHKHRIKVMLETK